MPYVEIKVFEDELSEEQTQEIIQEVTDVVVSFAGEHLRDATWVVVDKVRVATGAWAEQPLAWTM